MGAIPWIHHSKVGLTAEYPATLKQPLKIGVYVDTRIQRYSVTKNLSIHFVTKYPHIHVST